MVSHVAHDLADLFAVEPATVVEADRVKPKFSFVIVPLHVDVRWFVTIPGIEEEAVGTAA